MINKIEVYKATCDECGEDFDLSGEGGYSVFVTEEEAIQLLKESGWKISDDSIKCDTCIAEEEEKKNYAEN